MRGKNDRNYSNFGYTYDQKRSILFEISNFRSIQVVCGHNIHMKDFSVYKSKQINSKI